MKGTAVFQQATRRSVRQQQSVQPQPRTSKATVLHGLPQTDIYVTQHWIFNPRSSGVVAYGRQSGYRYNY